MGKGKKERNASSRIKIRGKDNAPLSLRELRQGLYDIAKELERFEGYRFKWATLYLTMIDEDGKERLINHEGEMTLYPYRSAADEEGV